jgi:hypothetical protein
MAKKKKPEADPKKIGRPSKYKPDFHPDEFMSMCNKGMSKAQICAAFGISRECMHEWARVHPIFYDAIKKGQELRESWWTNFGLQLASGQMKGNPTMFIWLSKNIVNWKDKVEVTDYSDTEVEFGIDRITGNAED